MTGMQKVIILLNNFGAGLFVPVLSLFLLSHGCDLQSLSVMIGIYSATVIMAEVPSGMFADMRGRKNAFFLSCAFITGSFILMYFAQSLPLLFPGMVLFGLGAAFLSGSLDSLIIEDCVHRNGDAALPETTGLNLVYQCAGIASGALLGGILPNVNGYLLHVIARLTLLLTVGILCALFLKEASPSKQVRKTVGEQVSLVAAELKSKRLLRIVLFCIFGSGITLFALETYWQPQFSAMITERQHYLLGVLCAMGYGSSMLGSFFSSRLKLEEQGKYWGRYLLFTMLMGLALGGLALQHKVPGFMIAYVLVLTMLGIANVPEQTLLNAQATDKTRASLLSVASLFSKSAGILSSAVCAILVIPIKISGVLLVMGGITVAVTFTAAILQKPGKCIGKF